MSRPSFTAQLTNAGQVGFPVSTSSQLAVSKAPLLALLTNVGGSSSPSWSIGSTNYTSGEELIDALSCVTTKAGAGGAVSWTSQSGMPAVRRFRCILGYTGRSS